MVKKESQAIGLKEIRWEETNPQASAVQAVHETCLVTRGRRTCLPSGGVEILLINSLHWPQALITQNSTNQLCAHSLALLLSLSLCL